MFRVKDVPKEHFKLEMDKVRAFPVQLACFPAYRGALMNVDYRANRDITVSRAPLAAKVSAVPQCSIASCPTLLSFNAWTLAFHTMNILMPPSVLIPKHRGLGRLRLTNALTLAPKERAKRGRI